MSLFSRIANRFIKRIVPPVNQTDWFTEFEAAHETWQPYQLTGPATPPAGVSVTPAAPALTGAGGGGHLHPDVERLLQDVDRYFNQINQ
jgi:hypothetical protein